MTVSIGDQIPDVEVHVLGEDGLPQALRTVEVLGSGLVVLFAVPGAFTPGCSNVHLPGFIEGADALAGKGVDTVACVSINDAWVMGAWAEAQGTGDIVMLADGNGEFTEAMGLVLDGSGYGLGTRSQRYAAVIRDGTIQNLDVEEGGGVDVSSCLMVLERL